MANLQESIDLLNNSHVEACPLVESIVQENVEMMLTESQYHIQRAEAPYLPLTLTTYRAIAYKKFKALMLEQLKNGVNIKID